MMNFWSAIWGKPKLLLKQKTITEALNDSKQRSEPASSKQLQLRSKRPKSETVTLLPSGGVIGHVPQVKRHASHRAEQMFHQRSAKRMGDVGVTRLNGEGGPH